MKELRVCVVVGVYVSQCAVMAVSTVVAYYPTCVSATLATLEWTVPQNVSAISTVIVWVWDGMMSVFTARTTHRSVTQLVIYVMSTLSVQHTVWSCYVALCISSSLSAVQLHVEWWCFCWC